MKTKMLLLIALLLSSSIAFGQNEDKKWLEKLEDKLPKNKLFKSIAADKEKTEKLVRRLKNSNNATEDLIEKYNKVQTAYNKVFDAMMEDINNANTIGGLVEELIEAKKRSAYYDELGKEAEELYKEFRKDGLTALKDKKSIGIKEIVDWVVSFLPRSVERISNASLSAVKIVISDYIDSARFKDWDNI
ncbi:MAG: hypothetical protein AB8G11_09885 [Saprospiraceae bacterium]